MSSEGMQITIKTLDNVDHKLEVQSTETIASIRDRAMSELKLRPIERVVYVGNILEDESTVEGSNIQAGHFIVVIQERDASIQTVSTENQKEDKTWLCKMCETSNSMSLGNCSICDAPNPTGLAGTKLTCPRQHELKRFVTDRSSFYCDKCPPEEKKQLPQGTVMYGCRQCDWDACSKCYEAAAKRPVVLEEDAPEALDRSGNYISSGGRDRPSPAPAPAPGGMPGFNIDAILLQALGGDPRAKDAFFAQIAQQMGADVNDPNAMAMVRQVIAQQMMKELAAAQGGMMPGPGGGGGAGMASPFPGLPGLDGGF